MQHIETFTKSFSIKRLAEFDFRLSKPQLEQLRKLHREEVIKELQAQLKVETKKLFPRAHFLKKFLLHDGLARYTNEHRTEPQEPQEAGQ
jgi:hypothetical protein